MNKPAIIDPYPATQDTVILPSFFPIPGFGILPVNAFVIRAAEPVLVDAGLVPLSSEFMKNLSSVIDPKDLRWLWLTHADQDHIGSLPVILKAAPGLKVISTFLGTGKMSLFRQLPMDRVFLLNPGQSITVGDRTLTAYRPPAYDAPETTGLYDHKSAAYFSADCFGALMLEPAESAADIGSLNLREGLVMWGTVDFPWLHSVDMKIFTGALDAVRRISPKVILSAHLPPATDMTDELLEFLSLVPASRPFQGPDQKAMSQQAAVNNRDKR